MGMMINRRRVMGGGSNKDLIDLIERDITSINIPNGTTKIGTYAFCSCASLTSINISNSVTTIGSSAFMSCPRLTSVTIPSSVTSIGQHAFNGCRGLTSVTIGSGVTTISGYVFANCSNLASVTVLALTPPTLGGSAFAGNKAGRKIYVPAESVEAYKAASGWSTYAADIEAIPT